MDKSLQFFNFKNQPVRVVMIDGKPNWVLADVCQAVDLGNVSRVAARLKRDGVTTSKVIDSLGREQDALCVDEPNLYRVIFQSRKAEAVAFQVLFDSINFAFPTNNFSLGCCKSACQAR